MNKNHTEHDDFDDDFELLKTMETCPGCTSETSFCFEHQRARAEYAELDNGHMDRCADPRYHALLEKYNEIDGDLL